MRLGDDVLAALAGLAAGRGLAPAPHEAPRQARRGGQDRLAPGGGGLPQPPGNKGGLGTGPNPTDRGRPGVKHHLLTEGGGVPLANLQPPANTPDAAVLAQVVDRVEPIKRPRGRPRKRPEKLHADKAYDHDQHRRALRERGIVPRIARQGVESSKRLGRHRWVVERSLAWLSRFRRLRVRDERRDDLHQAFLDLGAALIAWNRLR